jgi:hypothetical protein
MAAVVRRERAKATWLTGAVGLLILAFAFVMMAYSAPPQVHARSHGPEIRAATAFTASLITESWSASPAGRTGQARQ